MGGMHGKRPPARREGEGLPRPPRLHTPGRDEFLFFFLSCAARLRYERKNTPKREELSRTVLNVFRTTCKADEEGCSPCDSCSDEGELGDTRERAGRHARFEVARKRARARLLAGTTRASTGAERAHLSGAGGRRRGDGSLSLLLSRPRGSTDPSNPSRQVRELDELDDRAARTRSESPRSRTASGAARAALALAPARTPRTRGRPRESVRFRRTRSRRLFEAAGAAP